jgi:hypothetical protein
LATIRALKGLGASLADIRRVVGKDESRRERRGLLQKLRRNAQGSLATAQRMMAWLDNTLEELNAEREVPIVLKQRSAIRIASVRAQAR